MATARDLTDASGRSIRYLRLSVTDRCDLRCLYCRPPRGAGPEEPRTDLLSAADLLLVGRAAAACGVRKIRLTGGEPLLRRDLPQVVAGLRALPQIASLQLTTNGQRLADQADALAAAGLDGVNVSLDSLDPARYAVITRGGDLGRCLAGIETALAAGLQVKLNCVVMGGVNEEEILAVADRFTRLPVAVRFIEYMPTAGPQAAPGRTVPAETVLSILGARFDLSPLPVEDLAGPALRFRVAGRPGRIGLIAPLTRHFCADCNRLRVTAAGRVRGCLFHAGETDLRPAIAAGDEPALARGLAAAARAKPAAHGWTAGGNLVGDVLMSRTGG